MPGREGHILPIHRHQVVLDAVERASTRAARYKHGELQRGIESLATIVALAPLLGFAMTRMSSAIEAK